MLTRRTNVLLTEGDYKALLSEASKRKQTMGDLIREAIRRFYGIKKRSRTEVLADIRRLRKYINTKGINYRELIEDGRRY